MIDDGVQSDRLCADRHQRAHLAVDAHHTLELAHDLRVELDVRDGRPGHLVLGTLGFCGGRTVSPYGVSWHGLIF